MAEKDANCILLWVYQGGQVNKGRLVRDPGGRASGYCDAPDDCYNCPLMQQEISQHPPGHANWVCPSCLRDVVKIGETKGIPLHLTSHYAEGQCQFVGCTRPPRVEMGDDGNSIELPRGYSRLLQLVVGDINT